MSGKIRMRRARLALRVVAGAIVVIAVGHTHQASAGEVANAHAARATVHSARTAAHSARAKTTTAPDVAAGRVLGGVTAQQLPVIVTVSSNGKHMGAQVALTMQCASGNTFITPDGWTGVPVSASGAVDAMTAISPSPGSATEDAITGGSDTFSGKLNRKRGTFSGVWDLHLNFSSPSGQADSCDSGQVKFSTRL